MFDVRKNIKDIFLLHFYMNIRYIILVRKLSHTFPLSIVSVFPSARPSVTFRGKLYRFLSKIEVWFFVQIYMIYDHLFFTFFWSILAQFSYAIIGKICFSQFLYKKHVWFFLWRAQSMLNSMLYYKLTRNTRGSYTFITSFWPRVLAVVSY